MAIYLYLNHPVSLIVSDDISLRTQYELLQSFPSYSAFSAISSRLLPTLLKTYKLPIDDRAKHLLDVDSGDDAKLLPDPPPLASSSSDHSSTKPSYKRTYRYIPTVERRKGSRPSQALAMKANWAKRLETGVAVPKPLPSWDRRLRTKAMVGHRLRNEASWLIRITNGLEEKLLYVPKDQYPNVDDYPLPDGWYRGRCLSYKRKLVEWKDEWHQSLSAGKEEYLANGSNSKPKKRAPKS